MATRPVEVQRERHPEEAGGPLPYKFEIYRGQDGLFYWRFKASNGDVMVSSDPYTTKASAKHAIESMQANAPEAIIEDKL